MRRILGLEVGWLILTRVGGSRGEDLVPAPAVSRPAGLDRLLARGPARAGGARRAHEGVPPAQPTQRVRAQPDPVAAVGAYLEAVAREAADRGYRFDVTRIDRTGPPAGTAPAGAAMSRIPVTEGQVAHEWAHLAAKLAARSPQRAAAQAGVTNPDVHPLFVVVPGPAAPWERGTFTAAPPR